MAGYLADTYGFDFAFYLLTAFAIIALILFSKIPETVTNINELYKDINQQTQTASSLK